MKGDLRDVRGAEAVLRSEKAREVGLNEKSEIVYREGGVMVKATGPTIG